MPNLNYIVKVAGCTGKATGYSDAVRAACKKAGLAYAWVTFHDETAWAVVYTGVLKGGHNEATVTTEERPVTILKRPDDHWMNQPKEGENG